MLVKTEKVDRKGRPLKEYQDPKDTSEMVSFYLPYQQFMDQTKNHAITVRVNGYEYTAYFGKTQKLPKDVVEVLKNAKSAIHPMKNTKMIDSVIGGQGRSQSELLESQMTPQYVNDYNVIEV